MTPHHTHSSRARMLVFIAWRNLWRNRFRTGLSIAAFGMALSMMIAYGVFIAGEMKQMRGYATDLVLGHIQLHREGYVKDQDIYAQIPQGLVKEVRDHLPPGVALAPRTYGFAMGSLGSLSTGVMLRGISPEEEARVTKIGSRLKSGGFDLSKPVPPRPGAEAVSPRIPVHPVLIGHQLARTLHAQVGDTITLVSQSLDGSIGRGLYRVNGVLSPIEITLDRMGVVMTIETFQELMIMEDGVHELVFSTPDSSHTGPLVRQIQQQANQWAGTHALSPFGGQVTVRSWETINPTLAQTVNMAGTITVIVSLLFFSIAGIGLLNTLLMSVFERKKEFGILLALGMGRGWLVAMVFLESIFLTLGAALPGTALGVYWGYLLETYGWDFSAYLPDGLDFMGIVFEPVLYGHMTLFSVLTPLTALFAITLLATLVPAWRLIRFQPVEVMGG